MSDEENFKVILFVSTGRCGTTRLKEILSSELSDKGFVVNHQMKGSRIANIIGNILYYTGGGTRIKEFLFKKLINKNSGPSGFISTDPLTSMIIPESILSSPETHIIHIYREPISFGESFYRFTRKRLFSFVAHNFIPLWQINIWPLENTLRKKGEMVIKYAQIAKIKRLWFEQQYSASSNFRTCSMKKLFSNNFLETYFRDELNLDIVIDKQELITKANESK
jgi:hypothetical protein